MIDLDENHDFFIKSHTNVDECISLELAVFVLQQANISQAKTPLTELARSIHKQYYNFIELTTESVASASRELFSDMTKHSEKKYNNKSINLDEDTKQNLFTVISQALPRSDSSEIDEIFESGDFVNYLGKKQFYELIKDNPELIVDGEFFELSEENYDEIVTETFEVLDSLFEISDLPNSAKLEAWKLRDYKSKLDTIDHWKI